MAAGRPREFDIDKALDKALYLFWEKGYEGASMPLLTEAMGINRPSLYAAFGNKEQLFRKALDRYIVKSAQFTEECLNQSTAREAIESLLQGIVDKSVCPDRPRGCLLVQGALTCGEEAEPIRKELSSCRAVTEQNLLARFKRGQQEGDLPKAARPHDLARFYATVIQGMAVQMASGATQGDLLQIVKISLNAWPSS